VVATSSVRRKKEAVADTPAPWLQTLRLDFREFVASDIEDLVRLDSDPRVLKHINGGKPMARADAEASMRRVLPYYALYPGLGVWRAERRDNKDFVGWYCLKYCPPTADVEVGYRLLHKHWGHGYATEGARALVDFAFDDLGLTRVIGVTDPGNRASQHVLQKSGLRDAGWGKYYNKRLRLFAVDAVERARGVQP
jgi:RimJ/RimL family protein N-acetyltransferase